MQIELLSVGSFRTAMLGARLSHQSGDLCDSTDETLGDNDYTLACKLIKAGDSHSKFLRCIPVSLRVVAPLYFWKQLDQYKVGTTTLSGSTMHNLVKKVAFTSSDFETRIPVSVLNNLNELLYSYKRTKEKVYWHQLIGLLPSSFLQERYWFGNYQVLRNVYQQRGYHKLPEWNYWCSRMGEILPYSEFLWIE